MNATTLFLAASSALFALGCGAAPLASAPADYGCVEAALRARPEPNDVQDAKVFFGRECEGGSQEACSVLGVIFEEGRGAPRDELRAQTLYEGACVGGVVRACTNLGRLSRKADPHVAVTLFRHACDAGELAGCAELARLARDGEGMAVNGELAQALFARSCDGGLADACGDLASLPGASAATAHTAAIRGCALGDARSCASFTANPTGDALAAAR